MKNFKMFMLAAGVAVAASFTSCERDEYEMSKDNSGIAGVYALTQYDAPVAVDLNADGTSSANLITESPCFNTSFLRINDDYTYKLSEYYSSGSSGTLICDTLNSSGVWRRNDNIFTTTLYTTGGVVDTDYTITADGKLSRTDVNGTYPVSVEGGGFSSATGNISIVYTRP